MAVLKLEPTKAPSFSGVSYILQNAGLSMNRAFEGAGSLLEKYQEGSQDKVDNEVFAEIAGMNEEQLHGYFAKNGLKGRQISQDFQKRLGKRFGQLATTAETLSGTKRAEAVRAEGAAAEVDRVGSLAEQRGLSEQFLASRQEALANGKTGADARISAAVTDQPGPSAAPAPDGGGVVASYKAGAKAPPPVAGPPQAAPPPSANPAADRVMLARTLQAEAGSEGFQGMVDVGSVIVNRAKSGKYGEGIAGVIMKPGQFSAWNSETGYADGEQGQDMTFEPNAEALKAADQILSGKNVDQTGGATHYVNTDISQPSWLNDQFVRRGRHSFGFADGKPTSSAPASAEVDPLAALRAVGGSVGDTIGRGTPGINAISGTGPAGATGEVIPTGPGQQGLPPGQLQATAIPRGPETTAASVLGVGEGGPIVPVDDGEGGSVGEPASTALSAAVSNPRKERDAYIADLAATKYMTPSQIDAAITRVESTTTRGEAENLRLASIARQEMLVKVAREWAADPNSSLKVEDLAKVLRALPGTEMEKLAAGVFALQIGGEGGALEKVIKPDLIRDAAVVRGVNQEIENLDRRIDAAPIHHVLTNAAVFGDTDPVDGLWEFLELANDKHRPDTIFWGLAGTDGQDRNLIRTMINDIALEASVTPAEAAAGMAELFKTRDPWGWNTNDNLFNPDKVVDWLNTTLSPTARKTYQGLLETTARKKDELLKGSLNIVIAKGQRSKMNDSNSTAAERKLADADIGRQTVFLRQGKTWYEGDAALATYIGDGVGGIDMADTLAKFTPGSPQHIEAIKFIVLMIEGDPTKTPAQKRLLLATLRS